MTIKDRLLELKITLPTPPNPIASYVPCKRVGDLVYVSGQGPIINGKQMFEGKVGRELDIKDGKMAAYYCGLNLLAQLDKFLNGLECIKEVVSVRGFVSSSDDFYFQPQVLNGVSDLMVEVFGENGKHTRCALGTNVLPTNIPVEVEMVVRV